MSQTTVRNEPAAAYPGMPANADRGQHVTSRLLSTLQLEEIEITGTTDGAYSVTIDGDTEADYTASGNTEEEIRDALLADLQASSKKISAEASGTDKILVESTDPDDADGFTIAVAGPGGPDITVAQLVAQGQEVPFGVGVVNDPRAAEAGTQVRLPRTAAEITGGTFEGVARGDTSRGGNNGKYPDKAAIPCQRRGPIWVKTEDACSEGGDVYCRFTDPTADFGLGSFRSDDDGGDCAQVPTAKFRRNSTAGGLNLLELNLP